MNQSMRDHVFVSSLIQDYIDLDNYIKDEGQEHGIKFAYMLCNKLDGTLEEKKVRDQYHEITIRLPVKVETV